LDAAGFEGITFDVRTCLLTAFFEIRNAPDGSHETDRKEVEEGGPMNGFLLASRAEGAEPSERS